MKPSSSFLIIFFIIIVALTGCKSPTSAVSSAPYVTITPTNLHQAEFITDTFQVRIFNHDFAQTYFGWKMGDTTSIPPIQFPGENFQAIHSYSKPGNYNLTVDAYDLYSNMIIATTNTSVTIDTAKSTVEIIPQFYTGVLNMGSIGNVGNFLLSVKSSLPESQLYQFWDFGDGTTEDFLSGKISHVFPKPGKYLLKVNVYQKSGVYVGTDTAAITINWPPFSIDSIKNMKRAEVFLSIDSTNPTYTLAKPYLPLSLGMPYKGSYITSNWNGNKFTIKFLQGADEYDISAFFSSDAFSIDSLIVTAKRDNPSFSYSYRLENVPLLTIIPQGLIFEVQSADLQQQLKKFSFTGKSTYIPDIGTLGEMVHNWAQFIFPTTQEIPTFFVLAFSPN